MERQIPAGLGEHKHQQQNNKSQESPEENLYKHISKHI